MTKLRDTDQTRYQPPSARKPATDATAFASPLAKSRGAPGRRDAQYWEPLG